MNCGVNRQSPRRMLYIAIILFVLVMESFGQTKWEWHKTNLNPNSNYYNIVFTNGHFFALGLSNYLMTSVDGISWDSIYVGTKVSHQRTIIYGHAGYALACDSSCIWVSEKGVDWTKRNSLPMEESYILSSTYGNHQYLFSGYSNYVPNGGAWTLTSSDAVTWTKHDLDPTLCCFTDVIYTNQKFVAAGASENLAGLTMVSSDGLNWTNMTPEAERLQYELWSVAFGNNQFVALGQNGGSLISSDGVSWSRGDTSLTDDFHSISYGNGYFVGIGEKCIFRSTDGINWASDTISQKWYLNRVTYGNNRFVAIGESDSVLISLTSNEPVHLANFSPISHSPVKIQIKNNVLRLSFPTTAIGKSVMLTCHDAMGKKIFTEQIVPWTSEVTYDAKQLAPGWYVLSVRVENASVQKSFVINR